MSTAFDAPPGVTIKFLPRPKGTAWAKWMADNPAPAEIWNTRPVIKPRMLLVHTNGANGEGSEESAFNWSMAAPSNTKPHYQIDRDGSATKFLPSNRGGIANYLAALFSVALETADEGWGPGKPAGKSGFTPAQAETIAQIIAFESELGDYPIEYPTAWNGTGVACHTEPFGYPYWTNAVGKPCPGETKKLQMREIIMPRARVIRYGKPPSTQPPVGPRKDDLVDVFCNKEVFFGTPATHYKGAIMPDGRPRHMFEPEWIGRGRPMGQPLTNAEIANLFSGGEWTPG